MTRAAGSEARADDGDAGPQVTVRAATPEDRPRMIELCRASLGWKDGDPNEAFYSWKHDQNAFGVSPAWIAESPDGDLVGLRVFLRWRFLGTDGVPFDAVRAVDTATHPDWQGKGIFTKLTLGALPELAASGVDAVFNTPNDKSRPGYLKMQWQIVGRVPVALRLRSLVAAPRIAGARAAAEKWSAPVRVGVPAADLFEDTAALEELLARAEPGTGIRTDRSAAYLRWRYAFEPLNYRALPLGADLRDGAIVFRVRRRGTATEMTLCEVLAPPRARVGRAVGYALRTSGADYALRCEGVGSVRAGFVPVRRLGPTLVWRPVDGGAVPEMAQLDLSLGDVELF